jgi:hypothetical protein
MELYLSNMIPVGHTKNNNNLLLISTGYSHVFLYTDGWYNIWMSQVQSVFIIKCKLGHEKVGFLQNINLHDVHINQFSKTASKAFLFYEGTLSVPTQGVPHVPT